jgi:hypothetical protein
VTPPHELGWEPHAGGNFRAVVGKALWGDKAAEVGEGGAHADKLETVLIVELHQNHVKEEYHVPDRPSVLIMPFHSLNPETSGAGDTEYYFSRERIVKAYQLRAPPPEPEPVTADDDDDDDDDDQDEDGGGDDDDGGGGGGRGYGNGDREKQQQGVDVDGASGGGRRQRIPSKKRGKLKKKRSVCFNEEEPAEQEAPGIHSGFVGD